MIQHVLSRWLLAAFAKGGKLAVFDLEAGSFAAPADPSTFLAETDAHSPEIEAGIGDIEGPAATAARELAKRVKGLPPGLYAVTRGLPEPRLGGPPIRDGGSFEQMRFLVTDHVLPMPPDAHRRALLRYAGLMYQRAPVTNAAMVLLGQSYNDAAREAIARAWPGMDIRLPMDLTGEIAHRRERMLELAASLGTGLERANWFVLRSPPGSEFVLGDCPVTTTTALGHDSGWTALLAPESYVIAMPISPLVALLFAPQLMLPLSRIEATPAALCGAVNRLTWRHAGRYLLAGQLAHLEASTPPDLATLGPAHASIDVGRIAAQAAEDVRRIVGEVQGRPAMDAWRRWELASWQRWIGHHIVFGHVAYAAADRGAFEPPCPGWPESFATPEDHERASQPERAGVRPPGGARRAARRR